jgi:hypothetical protein
MKNRKILLQYDDDVVDCITLLLKSFGIPEEGLGDKKMKTMQDLFDVILSYKSISTREQNSNTMERVALFLSSLWVEINLEILDGSGANMSISSIIDKKSQRKMIKRLEGKFGKLRELTFSPYYWQAFFIGVLLSFGCLFILGWAMAILNAIATWIVLKILNRNELFNPEITIIKLQRFLYLYHYSEFRYDETIDFGEIEEVVYGIFADYLAIDKACLTRQTELFA